MEIVVYTTDDEEPICGNCEHFGDNFDCCNCCGGNHSWNGYERFEYIQEEN